LQTICLGWPCKISASLAAKVTGVSDKCLARHALIYIISFVLHNHPLKELIIIPSLLILKGAQKG
jgi:hypothetical protein